MGDDIPRRQMTERRKIALRTEDLKKRYVADGIPEHAASEMAHAKVRDEARRDDNLLRYAMLIIQDAREGKLIHDPAVAMQALMHMTGTTASIWKEYQTLLKKELQSIPPTQRPIRRRILREAKALANDVAAAAVSDELEGAEPRRLLKKIKRLLSNDH